MTEYAVAPATPTTVLRSDLAAMLEAGELRAYRVRANGTMRHLNLYPLASTEREVAEWISDAVTFDGRSVTAVARELHISEPTVRRYLEGLELTEEIEAGEWDDIWSAYGETAQAPGIVTHMDGHFPGCPENDTNGWCHCEEQAGECHEAGIEGCEGQGGCGDDACATHGDGGNIAADQPCKGTAVAATPVAPQAQPTHAEARAANAGKGYTLADTRSTAPVRTRRARAARPVDQVVREQGLPWPTDAERAAALATTPMRPRSHG